MKTFMILSMLLVTSFTAQSKQLSNILRLKNAADRIAKILKMPYLKEKEIQAVFKEMSRTNKDINKTCQDFFTDKNDFHQYFGLPKSLTCTGCEKIKKLQNEIEISPNFKNILHENNENLVEDLVTVGINFDKPNIYGQRLLHEAIRWNNTQMVKALLLTKTINLNKKDSSGQAALHNIYSGTNPKIIEMFMQQENIDVNVQDNEGKSLLHQISFSSFNDEDPGNMKRLLALRSDFNVNLLDVYNQTPLDIALQSGNLNTAKILREHGAKKGSELE